jgi:N-acetylmuramoyl-L-alanine amidase
LNSVCLTFCLLLLIPFATKTFSQPPDPSQIPEPQIAYALHATWDPDLTDDNPSVCTTSGTVAVPWFHFYAGWKDGAPAFFSVDWILIEELTGDHQPQVWYFENPQGESGFPYGCTMPPVSDPQNWNWTTWSFAPMIGFAMHNAFYRITVQWRYGVYMKGPRGPFQTSIEVQVENLIIEKASPKQLTPVTPAIANENEVKVKSLSSPDYFIWDGRQSRPIIYFRLKCASKGKGAIVIFYIFTPTQECIRVVIMKDLEFGPEDPQDPQKFVYAFVWDGKDEGRKIQPPGIYLYDVELDAPWQPIYDFFRSPYLSIKSVRAGDVQSGNGTSLLRIEYLLSVLYESPYKAWVEVFDPDFIKIAGPVDGTLSHSPEWSYANVQLGRAEKKGKYLFLVSAIDNVTRYRDHLRRPALQNSITGKSWWVWIDPGHGHNIGTQCTQQQHSPRHEEGALVYQLAQELSNEFNNNPWTNSRGFVGYNWQISRPPNTGYVSRARRAFEWGYEPRLANFPNRWSADLIVCLHLNSSTNFSANGTYVFYDRNIPLSHDFAISINNRLVTLQGLTNHGVWDQFSAPAGWPNRPGVANILGYYRNAWLQPRRYPRKNPVPSTLIECIFLSNHNDENWMFTGQNAQNNRSDFIRQLFTGIDDYAHSH